MRTKRRWLAATLLAATTAVLAACGKTAQPPAGTPQQQAPAQPVDGGTLNLSMYSAPKGIFNPVLYEDQYDANVIGLVFNGLLRLNSKLEWEPDLAESYTISPDNKTVTFKLRKDVKWHDGQPFTARDVAFTFKTILHPKYPGVRAGDYMDIVGAEEYKAGKAQDVAGIKVLNDYEISFTTKEPYAPILERLAFPIIPEHVFKDADVAKLADHPATKQPIGTGPFKFVQYKPDQYVELVRNEQYFRGKPHIEKIIYKIVNQEVALGQLQSGELDYAPVRPADMQVLQNLPNVKVYEQPSFGYQYMGVNHRNPILQDKRVRQALMYAINRQAIVDKLLGGHGTIMNSHMPPVSWAYDASQLNPYPYNPEKAKQLLAEAGWKEKNAEGYLVKDGKVLEFTLKYPSGNKVREQSATLIQDNLKQVGIKVNLEMMEFATLAKQVFDERKADLWLMGWVLSVDPDPAGIFLVTPDNKWAQVTGWDHPKNKELIEKGVRVLKVEERKPIYVEWAKLVNEELPYIFLYSQNDMVAVSTRVQGLKPDIRGALWNIEELWLAPAR